MDEPFAYVAHLDGKLGGVAASALPQEERRAFFAELLSAGFTITPVATRAEYLAEWSGRDWAEGRP